MASESGLNGDSNIVEEVSETKRGKEEEEVKKTAKKDEEHEKTKTVPFYKLFAFADSFDFLLMILGTLGSIGNGLGFPLMTLLFGDLIDAFGQNQTNTDVTAKVSKVNQTMFLSLLGFISRFDLLNTFCNSLTGCSEVCLAWNRYFRSCFSP